MHLSFIMSSFLPNFDNAGPLLTLEVDAQFNFFKHVVALRMRDHTSLEKYFTVKY